MEQENRNNYYVPAGSQPMAVIRRPEYLAGNRRDLTFGVILAVLAVLFVNCWLWHGLAAGAGLLAAALFFTGICYLWKSRKGLSAYGCVCAALFVRRVPYMKVAVLTAGVLTVAMSFANVDRVVAAYNVDAYQTGKLDTIDMDTLSELSDAAVPYLLELTGDGNAEVQRQARRILFARLEEEFEVTQTVDGQLEIRDTGYDLRKFDTVTYRARQLLLENWQKFAPQTNPA